MPLFSKNPWPNRGLGQKAGMFCLSDVRNDDLPLLRPIYIHSRNVAKRSLYATSPASSKMVSLISATQVFSRFEPASKKPTETRFQAWTPVFRQKYSTCRQKYFACINLGVSCKDGGHNAGAGRATGDGVERWVEPRVWWRLKGWCPTEGSFTDAAFSIGPIQNARLRRTEASLWRTTRL